MSIKKVIDCIKNHKTFLITAHQNLEGDALGSEIAFYNLLKKIGKSAIIVNQDPTPQEYAFLKGIESIKKYRQNIKFKFDVLVMLDCSHKSRCGSVLNLAVGGQQILNIDHHISNSKFGNFNWILPSASSTSEMIYQLYKTMHIKIDTDTARALYVGILTDTGSFRFVNTSSFTHQTAAELLKYNLDVYKIYRNVYEAVSFQEANLLFKIFSTIEKKAAGKIITFKVKKNLLKDKKINIDLTEYVLSFGRLIRDSQVCVLFKEIRDKTEQIRVNFRSQGKIDVNKIAQFFGGGGHKTASGCTIKGNIADIERRVIRKISKQL